jgi:phosphoserine phosphatase
MVSDKSDLVLEVEPGTPADPAPLCVDLDGTLICGDTLRLSFRRLLLTRPFQAFLALVALFKGRAAFKEAMAERISLDPAQLVYRQDVLDFLRLQKSMGRKLILATASHHTVAEALAGHLSIFDAVIGSNQNNNLKGARKIVAIRDLIHDQPFDYVGDSFADLPIFAAARFSYLVTPAPKLLARASKVGRIKGVFSAC